MSAIVEGLGPNFPRDIATGTQYGFHIKETGYGSRRKAVLTFTDCVLPLVDSAGVGGLIVNKVGSLPAEFIQFEAVRANMTIERNSGTTTSLSDTWNGDIGVGTALGAGATPLTLTEQDIVANTAVGPAVAGKATIAFTKNPTAAAYDATAGLDLYVNVLVDDADQDGSVTAATVKVNGTITIFYTVLGR